MNLKSKIFFVLTIVFTSAAQAYSENANFSFSFTIPHGATISGEQSINCGSFSLSSFDQVLHDKALFVEEGLAEMNGNKVYFLCPESIIGSDGFIYHSVKIDTTAFVGNFTMASSCHYQSEDVRQFKTTICFVPRVLVDKKTGKVYN